MKKSLLIVFSFLILIGCDDPNLPKLGWYSGTKAILSQDESHIIAQFSRSVQNEKTFTLEWLEPKVSAELERIQLTIQDKNKGHLTWQGLQKIEIAIKDNCAVHEKQQIRMCWKNEAVELSLGSVVLHLIYQEEFPSIQFHTNGQITLEEVLARAKFYNYSVAESAERVFRAKENITASLGQLLPHFNMRDLLMIPMATMVGPMALLGLVGDVLPFLFPSNWYQWEESKELYQAELKSYSALRGNEMNVVENLYYVILRDQEILGLLEKQLEWIYETKKVIELKESVGAVAVGSIEKWSIEALKLEQDLEQMRTLLKTDKSSLLQAIANDPLGEEETDLAEITLIDPIQAPPLNPKEVAQKSIETSLELAAADFLIAAAKLNKNEKTFGFLDPNSGSVFGFGYGAEIRVSKSGIKELQIKKQEITSIIQKKSFDISAEFQNAKKQFSLATQGLKDAKRLLELASLKLSSGQNLREDPQFLDEYINIVENLVMFQAKRLSAAYLLMMSQSKADRLQQRGYYRDLETFIPTSLK